MSAGAVPEWVTPMARATLVLVAPPPAPAAGPPDTAGGGGDLLDRLRRRGWRLSPQRRVVAESLAGEHVHLTADQVHETAGRLLPELSRATVYNTLNELVAMGEVLEVSVVNGAKRYDPNVAVHHHHLVCRSCQAIRDVVPGARTDALAEDARAGYTIDEVEVIYRGLCPDCRRAAPR